MRKEHPEWPVTELVEKLREAAKKFREKRKEDESIERGQEEEANRRNKFAHQVEPAGEKDIPAAEINKVLKRPSKIEKAVNAYKADRNMGSVASLVGLPRGKAARGALRKLLRKEGVYREKGGWEKAGKVDVGFASNLLKKIDALEKHLASTPITSSNNLGGGVSVTRTVHFKDGSMGVFKPHSGEAPGMRRNIKDGLQTEREVGAWKVAKLVGMSDLATPAVDREYNGERGVLMHFHDGARVAARVRGASQYDSQKDLLRVAAFDFVIGNEDRHAGNWMMKNGKFRLIDHGLTFPESKWVNYNSYTIGEIVLRERRLKAGYKDEEPLKSPKEMAENYVGNKEKILSALKKVGLSQESIDQVSNRISILKHSASWADVYAHGNRDRH